MTKARKDHYCTLCHEIIHKGEEYKYSKIMIWDHPDNDTFGVYKAHLKCDDLWVGGIGKDMNWNFPSDKYEWCEAELYFITGET